MNLTIASWIAAIIVAAAIIFIIGEYFGYKFGRMKVATYVLFITLGVIVLYAIYAVALNIIG
jgi:multisubunit Na+/H+ antiporter MnhE subunit